MKFYRVLTLAVIAAVSASFVSCDDDDDDNPGWGDDAKYVLPTSVTVTSEEEGTTKISFQYPTEGNDSTRISGYSVNYDGNTDNYAVEYNDNGQVTTLKRNGEVMYTYELNVTPKSTGTSNAVILKKDIDGNVDAYITINSSNQVVSYSEDADNIEDREVISYAYSGKNIKTETMKEGSTQYGVATYSYSKYNGVFRNVTTPQWFIATEFDDYYAASQISDAASKISAVIASTKLEQTYTYNTVILGFPTKFEVKSPSIDEETEKVTYVTDKYVVDYNVAR